MWVADGWEDYEVIDSSNGEKLERWGQYLLVRPDPQVIWDTPKTRTITAAKKAVENGSSLIFRSSGRFTIKI